MKKFAAIAIALMLLIIPSSSSASTCDTNTGVDGPSLTIISPGDGDTLWIDVVPPHIAIVVNASAPYSGIRSISVLADREEVFSSNESEFACSIPVSAGPNGIISFLQMNIGAIPVSTGPNTITVIAEDNLGKRAEKVLTVTVHIGLPPPPSITVSGRVTDTEGNPVPGALVIFESGIALTMNKKMPLNVTNTTGNDGSYLIENAVGRQQVVQIRKDGYISEQQEYSFENLTNRLDLELKPQDQNSPGFDLLTIIIALAGVLIYSGVKRKGKFRTMNHKT